MENRKHKKRKLSDIQVIIIIWSCILCLLGYLIFPVVYTVSLNFAIHENDVRMVKWILKIKGDINRDNSIPVLDTWSDTPIESACVKGNIEIIRMLLDKGANVNEEGWSPLILALANEYPDKYQVIKLLLDRGADVGSEGQKSEILTLISGGYDRRSVYNVQAKKEANEEEVYKIFILLINNGASVEYWEGAKSFQQSYSAMILESTAIQGNLQIMKYLVEEAEYDVNEKLYADDTALIAATQNDNGKVVEYLLLNGVDKTVKNDDGKTALDIAEEKQYEDIIKLLKEE